MATYYYLASSFPVLAWATTPQVSVAQFLEDCSQVVSPAQYHYISSASIYPTHQWYPNSSLDSESHVPPRNASRQWQELINGVHGDLARLRAARLGRAARTTWSYSSTQYSYDAAQEVMGAANPRVAEESLDLLKWRILEDMSLEYEWGTQDWFYLYNLQLQVLWRVAAMNSTQAATQYHAIYTAIHNQLALQKETLLSSIKPSSIESATEGTAESTTK